jgi:hypothetical protein
MLFNVKYICHVVYTGNQIAHMFRFRFRGKFRKNKHISLFGRYNIQFENCSKNIQYTDLSTATLRSQAIVEWSSAQHFSSKSSMFSSFAVKTQMYVQKCMQPSWKWNNQIKCPVQGIIQNFQFKCIFLENVPSQYNFHFTIEEFPQLFSMNELGQLTPFTCGVNQRKTSLLQYDIEVCILTS